MKQTTMVFMAVLASLSTVFAQTTNIMGTGSEEINLTETNFYGNAGETAAEVSSVAQLVSVNTGYKGGIGAVTGEESSGGAGLSIQDVDSITISNGPDVLIQGGNGGTAVSVNVGVGGAEADGGIGLRVNAASSAAFDGPGGNLLLVDGGEIHGGTGGTVSGLIGNTLTASGGAALTAEDILVQLRNVVLVGGEGGSSTSDSASITAKGGDGLLTGFDTDITNLDHTVSARGGRGGQIVSINGGDKADASGGNGINHQGLNFNPSNLNQRDSNLVMTVTGGNYAGGDGGMVIGQNGVDVSGGDGFYFNFQNALISGGEYVGGNGGEAVITNLGASAAADGGAGMFVRQSDSLNISGGTFRGGRAGSVNDQLGNQGAALHAVDSRITISGGVFEGFGLWMEARMRDGTLDIHGGKFGEMRFSTADSQKNTINVTGGTFSNVLFDGSGVNEAAFDGVPLGNITFSGSGVNRLAVSNSASFDDLYFMGSSSNVVHLGETAESSGKVVMESDGTVHFNQWSDAHFRNIDILRGNINFDGQDFNLINGASFFLRNTEAEARFAQNLTLDSGAQLDVGLGRVNVASNFIAKSGSRLATTLEVDGDGGLSGGLISGRDLVFDPEVSWTLVVPDTVGTSNFNDGIRLASASRSLTQDFSVLDFELTYTPEWFQGINRITNRFESNTHNLYVTYGLINFAKLFEDEEPELVKAAGELYTLVQDDRRVLDHMAEVWTSPEEALPDFRASFTRTPEMANALISMQSLFSDQIRSRTRSNLRFKNFGSRAAVSPVGAAGPSDWYKRATGWTRDLLPNWDVKEALRSTAERAPRIENEPPEVGKAYASGITVSQYDELKHAIEVPEDYQIWGRGYSSQIDRKSSGTHAGYEAAIVGGILGVDKRVNNMLFGLGCGYADTDLDSNTGKNNGTADTGHATGYFSVSGEKFYLDTSLNYAFNSVETEGVDTFGYRGEYDAHTFGFYVGGGCDISFINNVLLFTPEVSLLSTLYHRNAYTESSFQEFQASKGFPEKAYDSYKQNSFLGSLGATLSMTRQIDLFNAGAAFQPELRMHWLHEFNAEMENETYRMGNASEKITVLVQNREEDLIKLGGGVRFFKWEKSHTELGLDIDGIFGENYSAYIVGGKIMHRF